MKKMTFKTNMITANLMCFVLIASHLLVGCVTFTKPVQTAQTPSQKAYALLGTFTVLEETALDYVTGENPNPNLKRLIKEADAVAKPLVETVEASVQAYSKAKALMGDDATPEQLKAYNDSLAELKESYRLADDAVASLIEIVNRIILE